MGISTIVTPSHAMPEIYNTAIGRLLADPGLTRVLWAEGGFVMYGLTGGEPAPITTKGTTVELASDEGMARIDLDWSRLLPDGPRSGDWVGVLCLVATGQGIFDVTALPTGATGTARGLFLGYVRSPAAYVMAASVRGRREVCVQQPASRTHGLLRLQAGAGVRIESVNFVWAPGPTDRAKED